MKSIEKIHFENNFAIQSLKMNPPNKIAEATGYFGPDTMTWRLYREPIFVSGGVRALLLQVAHPAVAEGVARYSNFQKDPFGRGYRTFAAMAMIYFGDKKQADATAQRLWRIHAAIQVEGATANQSHLLLWVLATLTDTTLQVYSRAPWGDLPPDWQAQFYEESKIAARVLGIPKEDYPVDLQAFNRYFEEILHSDLLGGDPVCREMAQAIVQHPRAPKRLANLLAAGWLPGPLCARLGIVAGEDAEVRLEKWLQKFGRLYRFLPRGLRYNPAYHQAKYRIAKAKGERPAALGIFFNWLAKWARVPLGLEPKREK
jgi:uncharacterized protein (DUF2236 family)